jgi:hypothetical protein
MGTSLNGLAINTTYNGLLKTTDNSSLTAGFKVISDGVGNDTGLQLSTGGVKITGTLDAASASSILGLNSFGTISAGGVNVVADAANDTLTILGGSGIQVSGNSTSDTIVLNYTGDTTFVDTLNSLTGAVVLSGASGIAVQTAGQNINITYTGAAGGGVTSVEGLTGAVDISGGTGISISTAGSSVNIVNTGVNSVEGITGAVDLSGGTGIGISTAGSSVGITNNGVVSLQSLTGALTFSGNNITIGTSGSNTITLSAATGGSGGGAVSTYTDSTQFQVLTADGPGAIKSYSGLTFNGSQITSHKDIVLVNQAKIAFDNDPTNTYIQAGTDDPESIIFNADRSFQFYTDEDFIVYGGLSSPFILFEATFTGSSTPLMSVAGAPRNSGYTFDVQGTLFADKRLLKTDYTASGGTNGEIIRVGSTTTTAGLLYALSGSTWVLADRSNCDRQLGIAVGTNSGTDGMLLRGTTSHKGGTFNAGDQLYVHSTAGEISTISKPNTIKDKIRKVGTSLGGVQINFDPTPYRTPETFYFGGGNYSITTANILKEYGWSGGVNGPRVGTGQDYFNRSTGGTIDTTTLNISAYFLQYGGIRTPARGYLNTRIDIRHGGGQFASTNWSYKLWTTPGEYTQGTTGALVWTLRSEVTGTTSASSIAMNRLEMTTNSIIDEDTMSIGTFCFLGTGTTATDTIYINAPLSVIPV